ncbi:cytochrome c biogenesis protein [Dehalobacterium formicoaceticum]|uniref:Heme exporter protein C n=1 Tax=Dehalobacterium formicoaceticum TaxID=51515 RepID=A0ABT1Y2M4_9FIRM|nr:cytochrome c biogenesis protein [Dehalobacterium formicoaceticum]MCR6545114.1 cytochrome c biogenesis protein [Dehalobacterium formicoaceticum]
MAHVGFKERLSAVLGLTTFIVMMVDLFLIFIWVPEEKTLGAVQKIFYFHVGTAWVAFFAFFVVFLFSILYLKSRNSKWDRIAAASAEIGTVFTTVVLITGPIWAKSSWNAWWTWEPRLTTSLILWFIYVAYILIRASSTEEEKKARLSAVFGIIGFIDVPIVFFSVKWWNVSHPMVFDQGGMNLAPEMFITLMVSVAAFTLFYFYYLTKAAALFQARDDLRELKRKMRERLN